MATECSAASENPRSLTSKGMELFKNAKVAESKIVSHLSGCHLPLQAAGIFGIRFALTLHGRAWQVCPHSTKLSSWIRSMQAFCGSAVSASTTKTASQMLPSNLPVCPNPQSSRLFLDILAGRACGHMNDYSFVTEPTRSIRCISMKFKFTLPSIQQVMWHSILATLKRLCGPFCHRLYVCVSLLLYTVSATNSVMRLSKSNADAMVQIKRGKEVPRRQH